MAQITVIIPAHNIANHLRHCLDTVLAQSETDLEILCVDDGSTDGTPGVLAQYAEQDPRLRVLTQANAGPGAARNAGLAQAKGEYVIFLDSDDWFEPAFLEKMLGRAQATGADITICRGVEFDNHTGQELHSEWMLKTQLLPPELVFTPQQVREHLFQFTYGMAWDKLYRRELLQKTQLQFPVLFNSEDVAFVFPSLLAAQRIAVLDEVFIHHRVHRAASVSNTRSSQPDAPYQAFAAVKRYLEQSGEAALYQRSFLTWAMEFLVWHVSNMDDPAIQKEYLRVLKYKWLPELRFERFPPSWYESRSAYYKYLLAKYAPTPVFIGIVAVYKAIKRLKTKE